MVDFIERVGAALVAPRRALAVADGGRGGAADLAILLALKLLVTELRVIVAALWTVVVASPMAGLSALVGRVNAALGMDLALWLGAGVVLTLAAGSRRAPARDFDLAAVAWVPLLFVDAVAALAAALGARLTGGAADGVRALALGWMGVVVVLGVVQARRRPAEAA